MKRSTLFLVLILCTSLVIPTAAADDGRSNGEKVPPAEQMLKCALGDYKACACHVICWIGLPL